MSTIYLPDSHNSHSRIADDLDVRMQDCREAQRSDLPYYLAATLISLALVALCWLLSSNMLQPQVHQAAINTNATNQVPTGLAAPAPAQLNFSHGDMPVQPVFNLKDARPMQ
jgi:hypothetical protein